MKRVFVAEHLFIARVSGRAMLCVWRGRRLEWLQRRKITFFPLHFNQVSCQRSEQQQTLILDSSFHPILLSSASYPYPHPSSLHEFLCPPPATFAFPCTLSLRFSLFVMPGWKNSTSSRRWPRSTSNAPRSRPEPRSCGGC